MDFLFLFGKVLLLPVDIEKFPEAGEDQQSAEEFFQCVHLHGTTQVRKNRCRYTAGDHRRQDLPEGDLALTQPENGANHRRRQEEQQIDAAGGTMGHFQHHGQPEDQKASAADAQSRQKSKHRSNDQRNGKTIP